MPKTTTIENSRRVRHVGEERKAFADELKAAYEKGASIRELAEEHSLSYGKIHRLLTESGAALRGRGGPTRGGAGRLTRAQGMEYRQRLASVKFR